MPSPSYLKQVIPPASRRRAPRPGFSSSISTMPAVHELTVIELASAIGAGELSPVEVTDHYLRRVSELNDQVGAFFTVSAELAADQAMAAEKAVAQAGGQAACRR